MPSMWLMSELVDGFCLLISTFLLVPTASGGDPRDSESFA